MPDVSLKIDERLSPLFELPVMPFTTIPLTIDKTSDVLTNSAEREINSLIAKRGKILEVPTVLVGSGVSLWQPTGLPSGQNFTQAMYSVLFDKQIELSAVEKNC